MNGLVDLRPGADDFRLQHGDALVQLLDRQRVKVLTLEIVQRVLPSARGELVEIHDDSVDPDAGDVNTTVELTFLILRQAGMTTTLPSTMTAKTGRAPRRERVGEHVWVSVGAVAVTKQHKRKTPTKTI